MTTTAGTTSRGYRYPGDASATDVPGDLKKLADDVNTDVAAVAADGAVTTAKIAASAVTSAKIADATIVAGDLADGAVTSAKILDGTIVAGDLADGAVTSAKIADGTIATGDLADSAVTSAKIADGTIVNADVNASAAIDVAKLSGVVASATVGNLLASAAANCTGGLSLYKYTAAYGSESVTVTATDTVAGWVYNTGTVSVTAGKTYTFRVDVTASSGRDWGLSVQWRTGGSNVGGLVSSQVLGVGATGTLSQSIVAPAGADNVYCNIYSGSGSIGDTATFSKFGIWEGAGGLWAPPGTPIANLGTYTDETVGRRIFTWDTANNRWQMTYGDTGWREILTFDAAGTVTRGAFHANNHWGPLAGSSGYIRVRRSGGMLRFSVCSIAATLSANYVATAVTALPSGFEFGSSDDGCPVVVTPAGGAAARKGALVSGSFALNVLAITQPGAAGDYLGMQSFGVPCDTAWPTSLPGIAVGTIPA